jgi:hypothetical protein
LYGDPDAENRAVVLGDSVAISWMPAIRAALGESWNVQVFAMAQCPAAKVRILKADDSQFPECGEFLEWTLNEVTRIEPDLAIISSADHSITRLASGASEGDAQQEWFEGLSEVVDSVSDAATETVVLAAPPAGEDPRECVTAFGGPSDCVASVSGQYRALVDVETRAIRAIEKPNVDYVPTKNWFCSRSNLCPVFAGDITMRADAVHLTPEYSESLQLVMAEVLAVQVSD